MAIIAPAGVVGRIVMPSRAGGESPAAHRPQRGGRRDARAVARDRRDQRSARELASGRADRLNYVPSTADVKVGDRVVTSGVDGIYPKGFVVGEIQSVEREAGEYAHQVRPAVDFASLETVLVVLDAAAGATERRRTSDARAAVKAAGVLIAIALALALQTTLARFLVGGSAAVDLVLVAVVYVALTTGPVGGMLAGSVAGLIQDALSSGVVGIGGLAKAIVGFLGGAFGQQFIVTAALPRLVMFVAATVLHAAVFMGLYEVLGLRAFPVAVEVGDERRRSATRWWASWRSR